MEKLKEINTDMDRMQFLKETHVSLWTEAGIDPMWAFSQCKLLQSQPTFRNDAELIYALNQCLQSERMLLHRVAMGYTQFKAYIDKQMEAAEKMKDLSQVQKRRLFADAQVCNGKLIKQLQSLSGGKQSWDFIREQTEAKQIQLLQYNMMMMANFSPLTKKELQNAKNRRRAQILANLEKARAAMKSKAEASKPAPKEEGDSSLYSGLGDISAALHIMTAGDVDEDLTPLYTGLGDVTTALETMLGTSAGDEESSEGVPPLPADAALDEREFMDLAASTDLANPFTDFSWLIPMAIADDEEHTPGAAGASAADDADDEECEF